MASPSSSTSAEPQQVEGSKSIPTDQTVLQKHAAFFDRNNDGFIYPWETYEGLRAIGSGVIASVFGSIFINVGLSGSTLAGKSFSLLFPIEVNNIHLGKHGSDSGVYDKEGRFVPLKFEEIFTKHALTNPEGLTSGELKAMLKANRERKDWFGWIASFAEWQALYHLCKDKDGLLHKETIRAVYDGSLFECLEKENEKNKKKSS
ncbi:probable peroxygenase 4 isoform X2 [Carica papaya]|uniref:probable peroxygenase 4 isoform X2 n=1 Tax=Carica papaya TaxID=3649 RepID=UPI000B8C824B|nr:probable peroxygenase 4 isoform X2 [Carica papaya]